MKLIVILLSAFLLPSLAVDLPSLPANIEVDVIFPRNDTYGQVDNFPVILAIQNAALAWNFGFQVSWTIRNVTPGMSQSSSDLVDGESLVSGFSQRVAPADPFFMVNHTTELGGSYYSSNGIYRLLWQFRLIENCTDTGDFINHTIGASHTSGNLLFTVADGGKAIDLLDAGPCPIGAGAVGIQSNLTGCAHIDNSGVEVDPCNINIDASLVSSLSSELPAINPRTTSSRSTSTTSRTLDPTKATVSSTTTSQSTSPLPTGNNARIEGNAPAAAAMLAGVLGLGAMFV